MLKHSLGRASFVLLLLAIIGSTSQIAAGSPKRAEKRSVAAKAKPTEVLATQLFLNYHAPEESLADSCRKSNFPGLAIALNMNSDLVTNPKGEFETSQEYEARAAKLDGVINQRPIVICEYLDDNPDISFSYNADAGAFEGSFSSNHNVWRDVKPLGTYRSKTRMGVSAIVKASLEMNYEVDLDLSRDLKGCLVGSILSFKFSAPVSRALAPTVKQGGRLVFVGRLVPPYIDEQELDGEPTLDDPYDVHSYTLTVHMKPAQIALLGADGSVVWSCVPGRLVPSSTPTLIGDQSELLPIFDYPTDAYREHKSGTVGVTLRIGVDGSVKDCAVTSSSGSELLDSAACASLKKRAKFTPAADNDGNPIEADYQINVTWKAPY